MHAWKQLFTSSPAQNKWWLFLGMDKKVFVYFILLTLGHPHPNNHQRNVAGKTFLRKKNNNNNNNLKLAMHVQLLQSSLTVCDPVDCRLPGFSVHEILQARILKWVAMPFSKESSQPRDWTFVSFICTAGRFFTTESLGKPIISNSMFYISNNLPDAFVQRQFQSVILKTIVPGLPWYSSG